MVRLANRKAPTRSAGFSVSKTISSKTGKVTTKKAATVKHKAATNNKSVTQISSPQTYVPKIKTFLDNLQDYTNKRKKEFGASDPVAKKLQALCTSINKEIKKANVINPEMVKSVNQIIPSLKGINNVPQAIRMNVPKLRKFISDQVQIDVIKFAGVIKSALAPMQLEMNKLETQLNNFIKKSKNSKIQLKADPTLKRRFNTLNNNLNKIKTKWFKRVNKLNLHGKRNVQIAINQVKNQLDELQKSFRKNLTILNRYSKELKKKNGFTQQPIFTASQVKTFEVKLDHINKNLEQYRIPAEKFVEQLKAIKQF